MGSQWDVFNEIVTQHSHDKEEVVQKLFEQMFAELFGYSRLFGDIETHRVLHIGSTDRVIPDIIIRNSVTNKDLFIVELKQLNLPWITKFEEQLLSYMRLLSLNVGVLICDAIYLYYLENDKIISSKISINQDNIKGNSFMELFSKGNFTADKVKNLIMQEQQFDSNIQKIKNELKQLDIKDVVKLYFSSNFEEDEIDTALANIDFVIREAPIVPPTPPPPPPLISETIQKWVQRVFYYLLSNKILSEEEIYRLHDIEYSKKTFGIAYPLFVDNQRNTIISGHGRYWQKPICGYYICSQWWVSKDSEYDSNIKSWLSKVLPNYVELGLGRKY